MQGSLSIERMCRVSGVSRASFYRSLEERMPVEEEMEVRSSIQQIAVEHRRRGMMVNRKRVARIMREDNLLAVQPRAFVVTTNSRHALEVYLNLAARMKLTGTDQLWVADITYIRLSGEFVYLAVILDAWSRKVVGWELARTLAAELPMAALHKAIAGRNPPPGAHRQWFLLQTLAVSRITASSARQASLHSTLHPTRQRQGRTLHTDRVARVGIRTLLQELRTTNRAT